MTTINRANKMKRSIPNDSSEDETDSSDSEDEINTIRYALNDNLNISETSASDTEEFESEESEFEEEVEKNRRQSKIQKQVHWTKNAFVPPSAAFAGIVPPLPFDEQLKSTDYFDSMFGKQSITLLTDQSNLYSVQQDPNKPVRISETEMKRFIGILLMTGVYCFPDQRLFWSGTTRVESVSSVMSRDRFLEIKQSLHVVDNSIQVDRTDPNFDRAHKVRPLLNIIKENFRMIPKEEKLSVDEQIIPFKGKSIMKQHMPNKPHRWGYKMFLLAGSDSGICYDFIFYTGKGDKRKYGFCTDIVLDLCETVPRFINHKLYFDNYFTTIRLAIELKKLGIFSIGTVRPNRLPNLNMKNAKDLAHEGRGSMDHRVAEIEGIELCATRWYDNNIVNCLSTLHGCLPVDSVKRWSTKEKKHILIKRPNVIKVYNEYMGGVDLIDMLISLYRINIRSKKYYIKIVCHLIDLALVNAWLLYKRHCLQLKIPKKNVMSLLDFRVDVATSLLQSVSPPAIIKRGRPSLQSKPDDHISTTTAAPRNTTPAPSSNTRFDKYNHWPITTSKGRCRNEQCNGYSRISCFKCKVRLCLNENASCFYAFHN